MLRNLKRLDQILEFDFPADTGRQYTVQGSIDFSRWTDLFRTNAPGSNLKLRIGIDPRQQQQWLRVTTQ
jgi:hypothetical protein